MPLPVGFALSVRKIRSRIRRAHLFQLAFWKKAFKSFRHSIRMAHFCAIS